jgi:FkbM family methyltransferase
MSVKKLLRASVRRVPCRDAAIRRAALLPPAIKRRFGRQIERLLEHPSDAIETNMGISSKMRLRVGADANIALFYRTPDTFPSEASSLRLARTLAPRCETFVDVGANHGLYMFVLRSEIEIPVHFIEPNPDLYAELEANVTRIGLRNVQGHCVAMGERDEMVRLSIDVTDPSQSSITTFFGNTGHEMRTIEVECIAFDTFALRYGIANALVKVDIEGAGHLFVAGAERQCGRIAYLIIEPLGEISEMLARIPSGLHCYYINHHRLEHKTGHFDFCGNEWNVLLCWQRPEDLQPLVEAANFQVIA